MMLNKHLDILVNHWQRFIRPVKTGIGLRIGGPETEVPYMEMRINNFWHIWKLARIFESLVYIQIYPSQRQNLLPTLEIITHNFQNFQKIQNFGKKFQNLEFFS